MEGNLFIDDSDYDDNNLDNFITDFKHDLENESDTNILLDSDEEYEEDPIEEDDDADSYDFKDALRGAAGLKMKKKITSKLYYKRKMMKASNRELDPEVRAFISQANEAFVSNDHALATELYLKVIQKDPKNFEAYKTIGEINKLQGNLNNCCSSWLIAAELRPWDTDFWGDVADLSSELGHKDQAIYCYSKAITTDIAKSSHFILQRCLLYKEKKYFGRALEGYQKLRTVFPTDSLILKNLALVYNDQKRLSDAINLYMRTLDYNLNPSLSSSGQVYPKFGYAELNILLELYMRQHSWRVGIKVIKLVCRWLQDRQEETWWDDIDDDSEFDERRIEILNQKHKSNNKTYIVPIDIRYKLGYFRLGLDQKSEAMVHFDILLKEEDEISDLLFEAGKTLEEHGYHEDALQFLIEAHKDENFNTPAVVNLLGKCYLETADFQQAKSVYKSLLVVDPKNDDYRLSLAEALFHLGEENSSLKLLADVESNNKDFIDIEEEKHQKILSNTENDSTTAALIKSDKVVKTSTKLSDQEKLDIEEKAKRNVLDKFRRMERLKEPMHNGDSIATKAWMQLATQLVEMFMNVRSFFPRDKNRTFKGIVLYRRKKQMGIDEKIARVYNLYEGIVNDGNNSRNFLTSKTEFRGLNYNDWFMIFIQYSILMNKFENNYGYAKEIIDLAMSVSVFIQDKTKEQFLRLVRLILGVENEEYSGSVATYVRFFLIANQFSPFILKFFISCFPSGIRAWEVYSNYNHQKFFLRQLKSWDSVVSGNKISGMATVTADIEGNLPKEHPDILYVYASLLGGNRSYVSSVVYLTRAYKEYSQDYMICFNLGLAHVHRSMQRLSTNRHTQLLQGISYILEYRELRLAGASDYEVQEVNYNLGRLFHMLGLSTLAIPYYNKVLEYHGKIEEEYDLSTEAAYNLSLMYNINGNARLARSITEQYLTI